MGDLAPNQVEANVVLINAIREAIKKTLAVRVVFEQQDLFRSPVTHHTAGDMVDPSGKLNA